MGENSMISYWELNTQNSTPTIIISFNENNEIYKKYKPERWLLHYKWSSVRRFLGLNPVKVFVGPYIEVDKHGEKTYLLLQKPSIFPRMQTVAVKENIHFISFEQESKVELKNELFANHLFTALAKPFSKLEEMVKYYWRVIK